MAKATVRDILERKDGSRWRIAEPDTETASDGTVDLRGWFVSQERRHRLDRAIVKAAEYACIVLLTLLARELIVRIAQ